MSVDVMFQFSEDLKKKKAKNVGYYLLWTWDPVQVFFFFIGMMKQDGCSEKGQGF